MKPSPARHWILFAVALLAGLGLRWYFMHYWPMVPGDSLIYGDIAQNLLTRGVYGITHGDGVHPTLIRLPGYPLFLATCFRIFGVANYKPILWMQFVVDLGSCVLVAAFVRRTAGQRAAVIALFLGVLCPFTASYASVTLSETLSIFCVALGMYAFALELQEPGILPVVLLTFSLSYAALLRPDGALLAVAFLPAVVIYGSRRSDVYDAQRIAVETKPALGFKRALKIAFLSGLIAVLPFVPWTIRNWKTFHVFQPLAPRYATDPGESEILGFQRWTKTWCVDFSSTQEIYWNANSDVMNVTDLPSRAFDSAQQREQTAALLDDYNQNTTLTPKIDAGFAALAEARIRAHPFRYYVELPLARVANMWLRPRVEALPIDERWWKYRENRASVIFCCAYGALNLAMVVAAVVGFFFKPQYAGALVAYMLLRSALLATIEAPETRYTLECFPMIVALGSVALARIGDRTKTISSRPISSRTISSRS